MYIRAINAEQVSLCCKHHLEANIRFLKTFLQLNKNVQLDSVVIGNYLATFGGNFGFIVLCSTTSH